MGKALRGDIEGRGRGRGAAAQRLIARLLAAATLVAAMSAVPLSSLAAQQGEPLRLDDGRFTVLFYQKDGGLARSLVAASRARDSFPDLPRPRQRVTIALAPDRDTFRRWVGPRVPEWGAAIAFPASRRIILRGRDAGSRAGDPFVVLRHELAHLALHESLGDLPPRWFDEGYASYAAGEWNREDALAASVALVFRPLPPLDSLNRLFESGETSASQGYALAHRAVSELASIDERRGLTLFFDYWRETQSFDRALRRAFSLTTEDFEQRWRDRTRRRYGGLALTADFALLGLVGGALLIPLWLARRRRDRRRMEQLRTSEAAADRAARESALAALLGEQVAGIELPATGSERTMPPRGQPGAIGPLADEMPGDTETRR